MLIELLLFVLQTVVSFFTSLLLFRFYCHLISLNLRWAGGNFGLFVFQLTDWLVLAIRRVLPPFKNADLSCVLGAYAFQFLYAGFKLFMVSRGFEFTTISLMALFDLLSACLSSLTGLVFISILLSWVTVNEQIRYLMQALVEPLLRPFRVFVPLVAGIDLSPLVFLLLLQVIQIVLQGIYRQVMF